jgi:hypothetical protein
MSLLPPILTIPEIQERLQRIFPAGLDTRQNLVREMAAKVVYVFLYGWMVEGVNRYLRPSHVYFYTDDQAAKLSENDRQYWFKNSTKPGWRPEGKRWYADTTREPIRDETIRFGLLDIGAVGKLPGYAVTASTPIYFLKGDFKELFSPSLTGEPLERAIEAWQNKHLTPAARARMALLAAGRTKKSDEVLVTCPDGTIAKLSAGKSSLISKAVVEEFSEEFLANPALLWLSESGNKVRHQDEATAKALSLNIDKAKVLPDIILANIGSTGADTHLIFIEVVASDGPMSQSRKDALLEYVKASGFPEDQCYFGTAFEDRADSAFRKALPTLAWGTFAWFRAEPTRLLVLFDRPFDITKP